MKKPKKRNTVSVNDLVAGLRSAEEEQARRRKIDPIYALPVKNVKLLIDQLYLEDNLSPWQISKRLEVPYDEVKKHIYGNNLAEERRERLDSTLQKVREEVVDEIKADVREFKVRYKKLLGKMYDEVTSAIDRGATVQELSKLVNSASTLYSAAERLSGYDMVKDGISSMVSESHREAGDGSDNRAIAALQLNLSVLTADKQVIVKA